MHHISKYRKQSDLRILGVLVVIITSKNRLCNIEQETLR
jgi:hypothetical protein